MANTNKIKYTISYREGLYYLTVHTVQTYLTSIPLCATFRTLWGAKRHMRKLIRREKRWKRKSDNFSKIEYDENGNVLTNKC